MRIFSIILVLLMMACGPVDLKPTVDPGSDSGNSNGSGNGNGTGEVPGPGEEPGPGDVEPPPPSRILYVSAAVAENGDGSVEAPFKSIQSALDYAPDDAEIRLASGEYNEPIKISKSLTLIGGYSGHKFENQNQKDLTTIVRDTRAVGGESLVDPIVALTVDAGNSRVLIKNLEVQGANVDQDTTVVTQYDEIAVAVSLKNSKNVTIENSRISGGKSGLYTVGLQATHSLLNVLKSTILGGEGYNTYAMYFTGDTSAKVTDNRIEGGMGAGSSSAVVGYEGGSSLFLRNRVFAGGGLQNCFGFRVSTPTSGLKSFYNNIVDHSECTGSVVGFDIWGNSLRTGNVLIRNNTISVMDNSSSNQNIALRMTSIYNARVEVTNNIFEGDRRTTLSTCVSESDIDSRPKMFRHNNFVNCNFLYYRVTASGGRTMNTISELEANPETNTFGNLAKDMTFIDDLKPAGGTDASILQGGINGTTEDWPESSDYLGKARTGNISGLGWSMGAYEFEN